MPKKEELEKNLQSKKDAFILHKIAEFNNNNPTEIMRNISIFYSMLQHGHCNTPEDYLMARIAQRIYFAELIKQYNIKHNNIPELEKPKPKPEIDTSNIKIGDEFKNYKELCKALNIKPLKGNSRTKQEIRIQKYIDYEKAKYSQRIIILDIYENPIEETHRNARYVNEVKALIMCELFHCLPNNHNSINGTIVYKTTYSKLIKRLGLVNKYFFNFDIPLYTYAMNDEPTLFDYNSDKAVNHNSFIYNYRLFFDTVLDKQKGIIKSALKSLRAEGLLKFHGNYMIITYNQSGQRNDIVATDEDEGYIAEAEKYAANQLGYRNGNIIKIARRHFPKEFNRIFKNKIFTEKGWYDVYYRITINITYNNLTSCISDYTNLKLDKSANDLQAEEINSLKTKINNNICTSITDKYNKELAIRSVGETIKNTYSEIGLSMSLDDAIKELVDNDFDNDKKLKSFVQKCDRICYLTNLLLPFYVNQEFEQYQYNTNDCIPHIDFEDD